MTSGSAIANAALLVAGLVLATFTGRVHVGLAGPRRLRRFHAFEIGPSAVIGAAWWTFGLTAASSFGLRPRAALAAALLSLAALAAFLLARGRARAIRPSGTVRSFVWVLAPLGLAGLFALWPVVRHGRFATENDSLLYCALAQWYEDHSFRDKTAFHPDQPLAHYAALYQAAGYPIAPAFVLSAAAVASGGRSPLLVYPAVAGFALVLGLGSLLAYGRRVLRWPVRWCAIAGLGLAALLQPMAWAHHMGFLAQTLAIPLLLTSLALLSRLREGPRNGAGEVLVGALLAAALASTYPPLLVVLGGAWAFWLADRLRRRRAVRPVMTIVALTGAIAAALVALQGLHLPMAFRFLGGTQVGGHVDLSPWGFAQATLGTYVWSPFRLGPLGEGLRAAHLWLTPLYAWLAWRGLRRLAQKPTGPPLLGAIVVLGVAFLWAALAARDPWTSERGHTWNLFKLTQWSYPLAALLVIHGTLGLRHRAGGRFLAVALAFVPAVLLPLHVAFADRLGVDLETFVGSKRPLAAWDTLRAGFLGRPAAIYVAADTPRSSTLFLPTYLGLLTYPNRLAGDWEGALWVPPNPANGVTRLFDGLAHGRLAADGLAVTPIVTGLRGFVAPSVDRMGGGIGLVREPGTASVLAVLQPSDPNPGPGGCVWLGRPRTRLLVYSPREANAAIRLVATPPRADLPTTLRRGTTLVELRFEDAERPGDERRVCVRSMEVASVDARVP